MAIELTSEEQARLQQADKKRLALAEWKTQIANDRAQQKIAKSGVKNPQKIAKIQKRARQSAANLVKAFDKGFSF
jgi:hypothetical protein